MEKRQFLSSSSKLLAGSMLISIGACKQNSESPMENEALKNWAGNLTYGTENVSYAKSVDDVIRMVSENQSIRGLGSKHSFNKITDSRSHLLSLKQLNDVSQIDVSNKTIQVSAGIRYGDICAHIDAKGYAVHNLASLPHISVAGACATATHGSGINNGSLATGATAFEIVLADGQIRNISRKSDEELFQAIAVHLGSIGIITSVELDLIPSFEMQQHIYRGLPLDALETHFEEIMSSAYSVSLFTDWMNGTINQIWIKSVVDGSGKKIPDTYFGARLSQKNMHPIDSESAVNCTEQLGVVGKWYERLPHFKMGFNPSSGEELQAEYFVPLEYGYQAIKAIEKLKDQILPHLFISEIRTIAADTIWMSPFYKKSCVSIHFTFKPNWDAVQKLLPQIEAQLDPYHVRPHWGKLFTMSPKVLQSRIDKLEDFKSIMLDFDPEGKFRNEFINTYIWS